MACGNGESIPSVQLSSTQGESAVSAGSAAPLRFALSSISSPRKNLSDYEEIMRYIGRKLGRPVELVQRETYAEVLALIERRAVDAALVCSGPYVEGHDKFGAEILAAPLVLGKSTYHACVIVHRDSPCRSLSDLRGRSFALTDPLSTSGSIFPVAAVRRLGMSPDRFFSKIIYTHGHDNSIRAVAERLVDGAAVHQAVLEGLAMDAPALAAKVRVVDRSPEFGIHPLVVHPALDPELKSLLREAFLAMADDPEGRRLLRLARIEQFVLQPDSAYDSVRAMRGESRKSAARAR
ncbi:MAG: hypothetical protein A2X36_16015 [Elusimicrobia bacterium GWA2_69_24]|nr:MAG: hypothetical protein A2X36_16015 [Elusimicrobia bacterium GWA2_69_24]